MTSGFCSVGNAADAGANEKDDNNKKSRLHWLHGRQFLRWLLLAAYADARLKDDNQIKKRDGIGCVDEDAVNKLLRKIFVLYKSQ
ncbi:MAG: hypothetical protein ACTHNG_03310 [Ginsengibacter sp.]|jgi:hypothetical protein